MTKSQLFIHRKKIAKLIKYKREAAELSQQQLADLSGVSVASIQRMEYVGSWFSIEHLVKVAPIISIDLSTLDILA